jgi:hypothetical protein
MKILHAFNMALYLLNAIVWQFAAHHTGMAILSLGGVALAATIAKFSEQ